MGTIKLKNMTIEKGLQSAATFFALGCAAFHSAYIGLMWDDDNSTYTFVDFCPWMAWICACLAFTGNGDAKAGSAGGIVLFLGVYLGAYGGSAVQFSLGEKIDLLSNCVNNCDTYYAYIMWLCGVIFGSVGCFLGVAALAGTFTVAKAI